ncbi:hypothetical protein [Burkholderia pseudomallei]|uniref:hypothetical protein n=1 Tax=Burkholderia pseudomallei TaxID=28450 RepID=UPI00128F26F6|nr:hypothetical protein [Burkholderia pseudomallei]
MNDEHHPEKNGRRSVTDEDRVTEERRQPIELHHHQGHDNLDDQAIGTVDQQPERQHPAPFCRKSAQLLRGRGFQMIACACHVAFPLKIC